MFVYDLKPWRVKLNLQNEKKVVCFCSANFRPEICKLIIFSKQFQNGIFRTGLFWGLPSIGASRIKFFLVNIRILIVGLLSFVFYKGIFLF